ncbi:MAG TPA: hypothetical protein PKE69_28010, partial [Pyrinomonadaceae bacterium]|nr:hypothetical protein [Pyrinomonadaceae bacterium]
DEIAALDDKTLQKKSSLHLSEKTKINIIGSNSPTTAYNPFNGVGFIDAVNNPFFQFRQGRSLQRGTTLSLETSRWTKLGKHVAIYFQPRLQLSFSSDGSTDDHRIDIQNLYGKLNFKNFEIEIGRDFL